MVVRPIEPYSWMAVVVPKVAQLGEQSAAQFMRVCSDPLDADFVDQLESRRERRNAQERRCSIFEAALCVAQSMRIALLRRVIHRAACKPGTM